MSRPCFGYYRFNERLDPVGECRKCVVFKKCRARFSYILSELRSKAHSPVFASYIWERYFRQVYFEYGYPVKFHFSKDGLDCFVDAETGRGVIASTIPEEEFVSSLVFDPNRVLPTWSEAYKKHILGDFNTTVVTNTEFVDKGKIKTLAEAFKALPESWIETDVDGKIVADNVDQEESDFISRLKSKVKSKWGKDVNPK